MVKRWIVGELGSDGTPEGGEWVKRAQIRITGVVQGVGFRPFLYRLATEHGIVGTVRNDAHGVLVDAQGDNGSLSAFLHEIRQSPPPLARITDITVEYLPPARFTGFQIVASEADIERSVLIAPDVATCDDCLQELFDPTDRRYRYPFINCTNCGPRFTITADVPYDRPNTTMASFAMCPDCQREYNDPLDRRFHAQPNACPVCGPRLWLLDERGAPLETPDPVGMAVELLRQGLVVAVKGLGGFHLAVDATDDAAVRRLRARKHREEKPLAVMSPDLAAVQEFAMVSRAEQQLLQSRERPIVLLRKKQPCRIAEAVAPGNAFVGVMLPYTPLHHLLLRGNFLALVMTSGNLSEEPIAKDNDEAVRRLQGIADYFLVHNRDILVRSDDSVLRVVDGRATPIRRSRGYVPLPLLLEEGHRATLGCGAELKNTICILRGRHAFLSQHVGDLENAETMQFFEECVAHLQRILQVKPEVVAYDLHPRYLATQWALDRANARLVGVQHHHAHIAACLAENRVSGPVIGLALDGTGYGTDGTVWGGEFLVADTRRFVRKGHMRPVRMPGAEKAIRQPWRMALAYLSDAYEEEMWRLPLPVLLDHRSAARPLVEAMKAGVNAPLTTSCGRLFDGVAAIAGGRRIVSFEGQAAMEWEMAMYHLVGPEEASSDLERAAEEAYACDVRDTPDGLILDYRRLVKGVVGDVLAGVEVPLISRRFHAGLCVALAKVCVRLREQTGLQTVALSGGCFQNVYLSTVLPRMLTAAGFEVLVHRLLPPNDGCISLGQAVVASQVHGDEPAVDAKEPFEV
ncbi:MAG: carbamoyltransferase HypF [candidate division KSB1 bacterium]|nr:carbamoyltransferase HypF [candidate division KSB1 bacterium]